MMGSRWAAAQTGLRDFAPSDALLRFAQMKKVNYKAEALNLSFLFCKSSCIVAFSATEQQNLQDFVGDAAGIMPVLFVKKKRFLLMSVFVCKKKAFP